MSSSSEHVTSTDGSSSNASAKESRDFPQLADQTLSSNSSTASGDETSKAKDNATSDAASITDAAREDVGKANATTSDADSKTLSNSKHMHRSCSALNALSAPITEEGFANISKSCCDVEMNLFIKRVVKDLGLKVCDQGGLSGITQFYTCPEQPRSLYELMKELLSTSPKKTATSSKKKASGGTHYFL